MENFDVLEEFEREAKPLMDQLFELAKKYNVAYIYASVPKCAENDYMVMGSVHLNGPGRCPDTFVIASAFLLKGMNEGMETAAGMGLRHMLQGAREAAEVVKQETDLDDPFVGMGHSDKKH